MRNMDSYSKAAMERAMKVQEVILRAMAKKITWWQAAEIIGISDRQMRRWRERYEEFGYDGLFDRRRGQPSPKRVPVATVEQVLGLYRDQYFDLNVRHFHEKLREKHHIELSYTWVKAALHGAGLVKRGRKRGVHRKRRERRPLPGMLLHIDGSRHRWFQDERWYDLIVILDDATSEIYYAQLVEEESTATVMAGLREVIRAQGPVLRSVQRPGQPFLADAEGGWQGRSPPPDASGSGATRFGGADDSGLLAAGTGTLGAQLRHLAGATAAGAATARHYERHRGQPLSARRVHRRVQWPLSGAGRPARQRVHQVSTTRSGPGVLAAVRARGESRQHRELPEPDSADRAYQLAGHTGGLQCDRPPASGRKPEHHLRAPPTRALHDPGFADRKNKNGGARGCGKDGGSAALGNASRFPLSHSLCGCGRLTRTGHFTCYKNRTF